MCDMVNQIFFKNMKGKDNINWRNTRVTPSDTCDTAFLATFLKKCLLSYFSWTGPNGYISPSKTALLKQLWAHRWLNNRKLLRTKGRLTLVDCFPARTEEDGVCGTHSGGGNIIALPYGWFHIKARRKRWQFFFWIFDQKSQKFLIF